MTIATIVAALTSGSGQRTLRARVSVAFEIAP